MKNVFFAEIMKRWWTAFPGTNIYLKTIHSSTTEIIRNNIKRNLDSIIQCFTFGYYNVLNFPTTWKLISDFLGHSTLLYKSWVNVLFGNSSRVNSHSGAYQISTLILSKCKTIPITCISASKLNRKFFFSILKVRVRYWIESKFHFMFV